MKGTLLASLIVALAGHAYAGPDFHSGDPRAALAASEGTRRILPSDDVTFAHDSAALDDTALAQVDAAAAWLRRHPNARIVLEGYADASGGEEYNEDLATRRARTVRARLARAGVAADRIVLVIFGESLADPAAANPLDRRVVLYASDTPVDALVAASFDRRGALHAEWARGATPFTVRGVASR